MIQHTNKTIPDEIKEKVEKALSYFPSLKDIDITFQFKKNIKKTTMQAQPDFLSLLSSRKNRKYNINISEYFKDTAKTKTQDLPEDIFVGWIGHELGHILDYEEMSNWEMVVFGIKYVLFDNFIIEAEKTADQYAVNQGIGNYILAMKNFILHHKNLPSYYKKRIQKLYMSPKEVIKLMNEINEKSLVYN